MRLVLIIAGYISALVVIVGFGRRWLVRPLRRAIEELSRARRQLVASETFSSELSALAGACTQLAVALMANRQEDRERLDITTEMVIDLNADVIRLSSSVARLTTDLEAILHRIDHAKGT